MTKEPTFKELRTKISTLKKKYFKPLNSMTKKDMIDLIDKLDTEHDYRNVKGNKGKKKKEEFDKPKIFGRRKKTRKKLFSKPQKKIPKTYIHKKVESSINFAENIFQLVNFLEYDDDDVEDFIEEKNGNDKIFIDMIEKRLRKFRDNYEKSYYNEDFDRIIMDNSINLTQGKNMDWDEYEEIFKKMYYITKGEDSDGDEIDIVNIKEIDDKFIYKALEQGNNHYQNITAFYRNKHHEMVIRLQLKKMLKNNKLELDRVIKHRYNYDTMNIYKLKKSIRKIRKVARKVKKMNIPKEEKRKIMKKVIEKTKEKNNA